MILNKDPRFANVLPKIGIRPVLEGRMGGLRESLESQTMGMAKSVKELIEKNLFYCCGKPVECVIADTTISGRNEANLCDEKFKLLNVGASITVTPCWGYGTETMDNDPHIPKAVWGFNGTERPGAVYLAAVLAAYNQKGIPAFGIYGNDVQDKDNTEIPLDVQNKILSFAKAAVAVATMRNKAYLSIGSVSMGIAGSIVQEDFFQNYLGMCNEYVDMTEVMRRINENIFDKDEYEKAVLWTEQNCNTDHDLNIGDKIHNSIKKADALKNSIKMAIIIKDLMVGNSSLAQEGFFEESLGHQALAAGFQGQRSWTDFMPTGDFSEAILNSSFDWNGKRQPYILATENDSLNAVSMLFGHLLTNTAQIFADVRSFWSPQAVERVTGWKPEGVSENGFIHLINSGPAALDGTGEQTKNNIPTIKPFWEIQDTEVSKCLKSTVFSYAKTELFSGGGYSTKYLTKGGMPATMIRLNITKATGPVLHIAEGMTVDLPQHVSDTIINRTDPTWPTTWFVPKLMNKSPFSSIYDVMNKWGANHTALCCGHIGAELITLASMLRIPVAMHNVSEDKIFRPSIWSEYGCENLQHADYSACKSLGTLY